MSLPEEMMAALGKVYQREIDGALSGTSQICQLPKQMTERLFNAGLVEIAEHSFGDRFGPMVIRGCVLTQAGRLTYCMHCSEDDA